MDIPVIAERCRRDGLDRIHPFSIGWLSAELSAVLGEPYGRDALALLIGNSKALWPALARGTLEIEHPVDRHVEHAVSSALAPIAPISHTVYYAHRRYDGAYLPFQRIAAAVGQSHLSPSQLSIHPELGPWHALRAIAVIDAPGPATPPIAPDPCTPCDKPCLVAMRDAQPDDWRSWLAVRDACPIGRTARYSEEQIAYHYTKDPSHLPSRK